MFAKVKKIILDTLFPVSCVFCQEGEIWVCQKCLRKIAFITEQVCPFCEKNLSLQGEICSRCQEKFLAKNTLPSLDGLLVASRYKKTNLARLIHLYKYSFIQDLSLPLGKILVEAFLKNNLALPDLIIPVPLHKKRLRWRGFNQSELLAKYLSANLLPNYSIPLTVNAILRKKYTQPQMKIANYQARQKNMRSAFVINSFLESQLIADKNILLVDDICTTGSTLFECAKILKQAGAKKVWSIVLARQEM